MAESETNLDMLLSAFECKQMNMSVSLCDFSSPPGQVKTQVSLSQNI